MTETPLDAGTAGGRPERDPRYDLLMKEVRRASRDGYQAVSMRELAGRCRMSMTTIYEFCSSKDRLIIEAHRDLLTAWSATMADNPLEGETAAERVMSLVSTIAVALHSQDAAMSALTEALRTSDPEVIALGTPLRDVLTTIIDQAIGDEEVADREAVVSVLGHVFNSVYLTWMSGRGDAASVGRQAGVAVRLLLG